MDPFSIALLGGTALAGIFGTMARGKAEAQAYADKAQAARIDGQMAKLRGVETAELSRQNLYQTLGNIDAIRSQRGLNLDSATGQALDAFTTQNSYRNEAISVLGALNTASADNVAATGYMRTSASAVPLAMLDSLQIAGKAGLQAYGAHG